MGFIWNKRLQRCTKPLNFSCNWLTGINVCMQNSSLATLGVYLHCNLTMWTFLQCIGIVQSVIENIQTGYLVILGMIIGDFNTDPNC